MPLVEAGRRAPAFSLPDRAGKVRRTPRPAAPGRRARSATRGLRPPGER
jgi:hypothetical protein